MSFTIRRARREDARRVAEFAMKLVEQHVAYDRARFARLATSEGMEGFYGGQTEAEDAAVLVAEAEGRIIGFAYVGYEERNYAELARKAAWLHDIYVDDPDRHHGAGRQLVEAAVRAASEFGASKLMLSVAVKNSAGRGFFEKMGFQTTMHEMMLLVD
ncbi:MAG TPA: GNAT family N-acetyltransferase [Pyrinomonadaceae bacterium]|nr:GNAT family N-acetyltransferase [Pyrinomonadaceae bacterium]